MPGTMKRSKAMRMHGSVALEGFAGRTVGASVIAIRRIAASSIMWRRLIATVSLPQFPGGLMSGRQITALATAAMFLILAAPRALATCGASLTIDVAAPTLEPGHDYAIITVNHTFTGSSSTGRVAVEGLSDVRDEDSSGTNTFYYPISCIHTGPYTFRASATPTGPGCTSEDRATAEQTITIDAKPTIHASPLGLTGVEKYHMRTAADWKFPLSGNSGFNREIHFFVDGARVNPEVTNIEKQGSAEVDVILDCLSTGSHELTAHATTCFGSQHPDDHEAVSEGATFHITAAKLGGLSFRPGPGNSFTATVDYEFEATVGPFRRRIGSYFKTQNGPSNPHDLNASGTTDLQFNFGCQAAGTYPVGIYAIACPGRTGEANRTDRIDTTITFPMKALSASIDLAARYEPANHSVYFSGSQTLPPGISSATRVIRYVAAYDEQGSLLPAMAPITHLVSTGSFEEIGPYSLPSGARSVHFDATLQMCNAYARTTASVTCPCAQTADPVYLDDGNMRYTDTDPLPAQFGRIPLQRTYDSHHRFRGSLGRGWWTMFDRRLTITPSSPGEIVAFTTDTNESVAFSHVHGAYTQVWPKGRNSQGTLTLDTTAGLFRYQPEQATTEHLYRASDGRFVGLRDLGTGQHMTIAYDANGLPASVTDSWNDLTWTIATDTAKRRITTITAGTLIWTYQYDSNDNLTTVLAPGNVPWRTYEHANNLMTIARDALGNVIESHDYDASGRAINSTGPQDEIASIDYNIAGSTAGERITRVTAKSGAVADYVMRPIGGGWRTVRVIGGCTSCGQRDNTFVYDTDGHVTREQDASGYITARTYTNQRLTAEQRSLRPSGCDPATDAAHCRLDSAGLAGATLVPTTASITTTYAYTDPRWPDLPTTITTPSVIPGAPRGREESVRYHPVSGVVVSRTVSGWTTGEEGPERADRTITTTFYGDAPPPPREDEDPRDPSDAFAPAFAPGGNFPVAFLALPQPGGLPKAADGPRTDVQDVTLFVYYPVDATVPARLRGRLAATRNAAGHITRFEDYDQFGNVTRLVDPNGVITDYTYDGLGRLQTQTVKGMPGCDTTTDPLCSTDLTTTRTYDPAAGPLASEQLPAGGITTYTYDERGRVETISRGPSMSDLREQIEYTYDPSSGKKSSERNLAFQNGAWVEKRRESYLYDSHSQLEHVVHADQTRITYAYDGDGKIASVRDERHATPNTIYAYDPADRLESVTQTLAGVAVGTIVTRHGYDLHGNLTSVTDPNGNVTTYAYDDLGQLLRQVSPVTGTTTYAYDKAGNVVVATDANGTTTTRTYDVLGRPNLASSTRDGASETVTWTYDAGALGLGRLSSMTDPTGSTTYAYERRGLLRSETKVIGAATYMTRYEHDANGNRSAIGYPSGRVVSYAFDYAGRPQSATTSGTTLVSSTRYLPFGPADEIVYGNGTTKRMAYDSRYHLDENELTSGERTLASYDYAHDSAGNITAIHDLQDASFSRVFDYDDLNRLTVANTGDALWRSGAYTYDGMGNTRSIALGDRTTSFTYQGTTPKLSEVLEGERGRTVQYDPAGNEQTVGTASYTYSPRNHLIGGNARSYVYDGRGIRTITVRATVIASFVITPSTVSGGNSATGEVRLSGVAPTGGAVIALTCNNPAATVPASVTIAPGAFSATFTITTQSAAEQQGAIVTATYKGSMASATLTIAGPRFDEIAMQGSVVGGTATLGMVKLTGAAPEEGVPVSLESSSPAANVPAKVLIRGGTDRAPFTITTRPVSIPTRANISASSRLGANEAVLTILPPSLGTLVIAPAVLFGGSTAVGTLTLSGPAPTGGLQVTLVSSSDAVAVPGTLLIAEGATSATFTLTVTPVNGVTRARVTAMIPGSEEGVETQVTIQPPVLTELSVTPGTVVGGEPAAAQTTINAPAASQGATIELTTSDPTTVIAPPHVVIPSGATTATASLDTAPVAGTTPIIISATRDGVTRSTTLTLTAPPITLSTLAITPSSLVGTNRAIGTVTLTDSARDSLEIALSSSEPGLVSVPPIVTVPGGAREASFLINTALVTTTTSVLVTAAHGVTSRTSTVTVLPPAGNYVSGLSVAPAFIVRGTTASGSVTLAVPVTEPSANVTITSSDPATSVPATIRVHHNQQAATFDVIAHPVSTPTPVELTAAYGGVVQRMRVIVAPENAVVLSSVTVNPNRVIGGDGTQLTVTLTAPAPPGGAAVSFSWRPRKMLTMPLTITVPEGGTAATVSIGTSTVHGQQPRDAEIEASYNNVTATATLTITPRTTSEARHAVAQCASLSIAPCLTAIAIPHDAPATERVFSFYTPELNLLAETGASSASAPAVAYEYLWFGGQPVAQIRTSTGEIHWYFNDHLGTPIIQTDGSARVVWRVEYQPYGTSSVRVGEAKHQPLRLPGQENDGTSDVSYNVFRWYRADWGRYTSADPIGLQGGVNLYNYAVGNPIGATDPMGLSAAGAVSQLRDLVRWPLGFNDGEIYNDGPVVQDLRRTPMWRDILRQFRASGCNTEATYCANFNYPSGPLRTGMNAGQMVGSFCARLTRIRDNQVLVRAWNDWGLESGTRLSTSEEGRSNPSIEAMIRTGIFAWPPKSAFEDRDSGPFRTIRNRYRWIENVCCD